MPGSMETGRQVAELALQLGRMAYGELPARGLTPAQWTALRFFARANRFSRTVSAFADFHGTTRGTASQTVKGLVTRGYLKRTPSERDGRSARFDLTTASRRILEDDPFEAVVRAALCLSPADQVRTAGGLRILLRQLADKRERPVPSRCALCSHLGLGRGKVGKAYECRLLKEPLEKSELDELCICFVQRPGKAGSA